MRALCSDETFRARFQLEARAVAQLDHPNILPILDAGEFGETLYVVTELMTSGSLVGRLGSRFGVGPTASLLAGIASALDYGHAAGYLHHDLKPSKVLLKDGGAILADFGLGRIL